MHVCNPWVWTINNEGYKTKVVYLVNCSQQNVVQYNYVIPLTLPEHLSSFPVFSGVRVTRSLVLYVCFVDRCLSFCTLSFGLCVVCSSLIYGFWLPLWYLQTLLLLTLLYPTAMNLTNLSCCTVLYVLRS
jgi:hypothetical protein